MKKYLELIRVNHWIKNILIFIPIICAKVISFENIIISILGFISYSFLCSFVYIINDINDIESDKKHPKKKKRPLPSGRIKKNTAIIIAIFILVLSFGMNTLLKQSILNVSFYLLLVYLLLNLAYSFGLKNKAIIDIIILALGFIIRVYYGASLINVEVSDWLFLTILNASFFLGLGKRRKEIEKSKDSRKVLREYNAEFLNKFQYLTLTLTIVFYSLWTMEQGIKYICFTIPLLMIIFMKYCLIIEKNDEGDPTTVLYNDFGLLSLCGIYGIIMLYFMVI